MTNCNVKGLTCRDEESSDLTLWFPGARLLFFQLASDLSQPSSLCFGCPANKSHSHRHPHNPADVSNAKKTKAFDNFTFCFPARPEWQNNKEAAKSQKKEKKVWLLL